MRFDFSEMAKRSLGSHWQRTSGDEQRQLVELFTELLEKSYLDQSEAYDGEKIVYGRESSSQDQVETKILTKKGEEFSLNHKLRGATGDWKIYDVIIENVSLVNNVRFQFNRILANANASVAELIKPLQSKALDVKAVRGLKKCQSAALITR